VESSWQEAVGKKPLAIPKAVRSSWQEAVGKKAVGKKQLARSKRE